MFEIVLKVQCCILRLILWVPVRQRWSGSPGFGVGNIYYSWFGTLEMGNYSIPSTSERASALGRLGSKRGLAVHKGGIEGLRRDYHRHPREQQVLWVHLVILYMLTTGVCPRRQEPMCPTFGRPLCE